MWTTENISDQSGRTALITGANSGIGYEIALALYQKGADVIVAGRNSVKIEEAIQKIKSTGGTGKLTAGILDLTSLKQIRHFAENIKKEHHSLDLLINNAGVMTPPQSKTEDGFEIQFGVNFLAHYVLTGHLYSLLKNSPKARVVTLSSGAHKMVDSINFDNLRSEFSYDAQREYAISKLADLQFMTELQRRINSAGDLLISTAAHPGVTESNLSRFMDREDYKTAVEKYGAPMPTWQGALPALYAATSTDVSGNDYYGPDGQYELQGFPAAAAMSKAAQDMEAAAKLWKYSEEVTGVCYP